MTTFSDIVAEIETYAVDEFAKVKAEAVVIEQTVVPVIETKLADGLKTFGQVAVQTVINFMGPAGGALSGEEKLGLSVTTLLQYAETNGLALVEELASDVIETAYSIVMGKAPAAA